MSKTSRASTCNDLSFLVCQHLSIKVLCGPEIKDAYDVLVDPDRRARYDALGKDGEENGGMSGLNPLEEMLMRSMGLNTGGSSQLPQARDAVHPLYVTLEECYKGAGNSDCTYRCCVHRSRSDLWLTLPEKELEVEIINSPRGTKKSKTLKA